MRKLLEEVGGSLGFWGDTSRLAIGEVEELWDLVGIAIWPSRKVMFETMMSERMQQISVHRSAGLSGQLNIETTNIAGDWLPNQTEKV